MKHTLLATALLGFALAASAAGPAVHAEQPLATGASPPDRVDGASAPVRSEYWVKTQNRDRRGGGRGVGAILYSNPDFRGDRYVVAGNYMRDLANTGFNDRAQSLQVERGYWIFCSDADFQGTLPHVRPRRISPSPPRPGQQDFLGSPDFRKLSVSGPSELGTLTLRTLPCRSSMT